LRTSTRSEPKKECVMQSNFCETRTPGGGAFQANVPGRGPTGYKLLTSRRDPEENRKKVRSGRGGYGDCILDYAGGGKLGGRQDQGTPSGAGKD